jgi:DNA helicase-2/ATP-dependent DNA helicase PcrA
MSQKSLFDSSPSPQDPPPQRTETEGEHDWNEHQEKIFAWTRDVATGTTRPKHAQIRARAGTGKTTTAIKMAGIIKEEDPGAEALFCTFTRDIAEEIAGRLEGSGFESSTIHSIGLGAIFRHVRPSVGDITVEDWKYLDLIDDWARSNYDGYREEGWYSKKWDIYNVVSYCQNVLADPTDEDEVVEIALKRGVPVGTWVGGIADIIGAGLDAVEEFGDVGFNDMIYYTAVRNLSLNRYHWVIIDEAQDLNPAQRVLVDRMIGPETSSVWIGDENQAIFQFQGADPEGFLDIASGKDVETFELPVSYRCPETHVREAKRLVSGIECPEGASEGTFEVSEPEDFYRKVRPGDVVLSRRNTPLVRRAVGMIQRRRPAEIVGDDLPKRLKGIIYRVSDVLFKRSILAEDGRTRLNSEDFETRDHRPQDYVVDYEKFPTFLSDWSEKKREKLSAQGASESKIGNVLDMEACIRACYEGFSSAECPAGLIEKIYGLFDKKSNPTLFSTVHKAKGQEWDRVHIIDTDSLPLEFEGDRPPGEMNVKYVCLTRSSSYINVFGDLWSERDGVSVGDPLPGERAPGGENGVATEELKTKIAKLLRKASSTGFEPEKRAFRSKAEELLSAYDLTEADLRSEGFRIEAG